METTTPNTTVLPQRHWKEMLKKSEMQKLVNTSSQVDNKSESERVQVYLDQDMKYVIYLTGSKENKIEISSITDITSTQTDLSSFSFVELQTKMEFHFQAANDTLAQHWVQGLQILINNQRSSHRGVERRNQWLREMFQALSTTDHHELKYIDVFSHVLNGRQNVVSQEFFKQKLKEFLKAKKLKYKEKNDGFLILENFIEFYKFIFDRNEIVNLFQRMASDGAFISLLDLEYFLTEEQYHPEVTQQRCKEIIVKHEVTQVGREKLELNIDGFTHFMLSENEQIFNTDHDRVYQDMNQPLPHYYIASSHNTYLCGRQLSGGSSAEAYSDVLEKGCRCVELDCWDGENNEPIVYHGHTLTTKILFKDIIKAINKSAFKTSPYPVIVSLENHCGLEAQKNMASYLVEIFGDKMHRIPVDKSLGEFPSPEFFKYKILIRGKVHSTDDDEDISQTNGNLIKNTGKASENESEEKVGNSKEVTSSREKDDRINVQTITAKLTPPPSPSTRRKLSTSKRKVVKELSDLINYVSNSKFVSFEESDKSGKFWQSSSFVEGDMEYHAGNSPEAFIRFNRRQMSRIYPGGLRIDSSNYSPLKPWNIGCQIVALNHQTNDEGMTLHYGKFRQNGRAGYVLKPLFLRDSSIKFNPNNVSKPVPGSKVLKLTIISGQQLPEQPASWSVIKDEPDPYVQVKVYGVPADEFTATTTTLYDNSFNPTWNESFKINVLVPELAMIKFSVYDKDVGFDDFIGQALLPLESLQQGYRHVPLVDNEGVPVPCASIFIYVVFEELKPESSDKAKQLNLKL